MHKPTGIRRVILLVLDGVRPDVIDTFNLTTLKRVRAGGAASIRRDRLHAHRAADLFSPLPGILAAANLPTSAFSASVPAHLHGVATRIAGELGIADLCMAGDDAPAVLQSARHALSAQRRGLILLHWSDAGRAGRAHGWASAPYEEATRRMDTTLSLLMALTEIPRDSGTLLIVASDTDADGGDPRHDAMRHQLDRSIMMLMGSGVRAADLPHEASVMDIPATILWALGLPAPADYSGVSLSAVFRRDDAPTVGMGVTGSSAPASSPLVSAVM